MDIEVKAIHKVEDYFADTDRIKAFLQQGDKEPSWDGHLYLYKDKTKSKNGLLRIPTQVKGMEYDHRNRTKLKYKIEMLDLENYFNDGGCIFLVVCFKNTKDYKIYYTSLLPVKIKNLQKKLENKKKSCKDKNKKITVELKILPENENELISILMNFIYDRDRQFSLRDKIIPLDNIIKNKKEFTITKFVTSPNKLQDLNLLIGEDIYGYVNVNDVDYPIELFTIKSYCETLKVDVLVAEKKFYNNIRICNDGKIKTQTIGESFKIIENVGALPNKFEFSYKIKGTLKQRIKDINFLIEAFTKNEFTINNKVYHFKDVINTKIIDELNRVLINLQHIDTKFKELNIEKDLDIDNFTKQDWDSLSLFKKTFIDKQIVSKINPSDQPFSILRFGAVQILTAIEKCNNGYIMKDYRESKIVLVFEQEGKEYRLPKEVGLVNTGGLNVDNFDIGSYLDIIKAINPELNYFTFINYNLLNFIKKFDESNDIKYYNIALELSEWLSENYPQFYIVNNINRLQIKKRKNTLTLEDKTLLYDFIKNAICADPKDTITIYCSAVLLEDKEILKDIKQEMTSKELEDLKKLPIEFVNKGENDGKDENAE